jgi:hypothetical protein
LHHLSKTHARRREVGVMLDGIHQLGFRFAHAMSATSSHLQLATDSPDFFHDMLAGWRPSGPLEE